MAGGNVTDRGLDKGSDSEVMMRVKDGQIDQMGILFERHHERLLSYLMRMTASRASAEDLVQEVFVRMLRYRESFRGNEGGFLPWMYRLARNACTDHLRKVTRRGETQAPEQEPLGDDPSVAEQVEKRESVDMLRRALMRLAPEKREVLILNRFDFKKFDEIAEIVGCPVGTAKVRAHRALRELRQIYNRMLSEASI